MGGKVFRWADGYRYMFINVHVEKDRPSHIDWRYGGSEGMFVDIKDLKTALTFVICGICLGASKADGFAKVRGELLFCKRATDGTRDGGLMTPDELIKTILKGNWPTSSPPYDREKVRARLADDACWVGHTIERELST